jgi:hypothetical protein
MTVDPAAAEARPAPAVRSPTPAALRVYGGLVAAAGLPVLAVGLGLLSPAPDSVHAPRWVLVAASLVFLAGGGAVIAQSFGPRGAAAGRAAAGVVVLALGLVLHWIAFGAGPRQFSGGLSLGPVATATAPGERNGRAAFGIFAVGLDLLALAVAVRAWRRRRDQNR